MSASMVFALPVAAQGQQPLPSPPSPHPSAVATGAAEANAAGEQPAQAVSTTGTNPATDLEARANAAAARVTASPTPSPTPAASTQSPDAGSAAAEQSRAAVVPEDKPNADAKLVQRSVSKAEPEKSEPKLVISSWAGAYGDAQRRAIITPVARDLGIQIERKTPDGEGIAAADVTEMDQASLMEACRTGRVLKLGEMVGNLDSGDFLVDQKGRCGVPTFAWSSMIIANGAAMKELARSRYRAPDQLSHLLDTKRYPGQRALIRDPKRLMEMLLLADGVSRDELYARLATRGGQDRAFELLDQLNKNILWVEGSREALHALDEGQATFAMTYSGRAFRRLIASQLLPIWDGHIIDYASWAVSARSRQPDAARKFILAATTAEHLAAQARLWPYGPMRRSALPLARRHDLLDTELDPYMPTSELRFGQGVVLNAEFWAEHGARLRRRFADWQAGIPLGVRVPVPRKAPPPPAPPLPRRSE